MLFILYLFFKIKKTILRFNFYLLLIFFNFIVFFVFPWEPSFLWLSMISIFLILIWQINYKLIYLLVFFNLLNWVFQLEIVKIKYNINNCYKTPVSANLKFHLS